MIMILRRANYQDLRDDPWLLQWLEDVDHGPSRDHHQRQLQDEERERVIERVIPLPYAVGRDHSRRIAHYRIVCHILLHL